MSFLGEVGDEDVEKPVIVHAFARANRLDCIVFDSPEAKLGIATCGKSYMDVRQALQYLGIDDSEARRLGLRLYKVGMTFPLEPQGAAAFAQGLEKIIVVEEKRGLIEPQLKEALYGRVGAPQIVGKHDERGPHVAGHFHVFGAFINEDVGMAKPFEILAC